MIIVIFIVSLRINGKNTCSLIPKIHKMFRPCGPGVFVSKNILIIDSNADFCEQASTLLGNLPVQITVVNSGRTGVSKANKLKPDLVILSAELDDMNGYMACKNIRKNDSNREIKVILTSSSAKSSDFEKHKRLKDRADAYLSKPLEDGELVREVIGLLGTDDDFKGFTDLVEDVDLNDWVSGKPDLDDSHPHLHLDDEDMNEAPRERLQELIESQSRELEYLRKETSAFKSFMEQANKTEKALKETREQLASKEKLLHDLRAHEGQTEIQELLNQITTLEKESDKTESALADETRERKKVEREAERLRGELKNAMDNLDESVSNMDQLKKAARAAQDISRDLEEEQRHITTLQSQVQDLQGRLSEKEKLANSRDSELITEKEAHQSALEELENLRQNLAEARKDRKQAEQKRETSEVDNARLRDERDNARRDVEQSSQKIEEFQNRISDLEAAVNAAGEETKLKEKQLDQLRGSSETDRKGLELEIQHLKSEIDTHKKADEDRSRQIKEKEDDLSKSIEERERLKTELDKMTQVATSLRDNLEEEKNVARSGLAEVENRAHTAESALQEKDEELKTLRKDHLDARSQVTTLAGDLNSARLKEEEARVALDEMRREHTTMLEKVEAAESSINSDKVLFESQKNELTARNDALNTLLKQTKQEHEIALSVLNQENAAIQEASQNERQKLRDQNRELESKLHGRDDTIQTLERRLEQSEQNQQKALDALKEVHLSELDQVKEESELEKTRLREERRKIKEELENTISNLRTDKKDLETRTTKLEEKAEQSNRDFRSERETLNNRVAELEHERETLNRAAQKERESKENAEGKISDLNHHIITLNEDHEKAISDIRGRHTEQLEKEKHILHDERQRVADLENKLRALDDLVEKHKKLEKENDALKLGQQMQQDKWQRMRQCLAQANALVQGDDDDLQLDED